MPYLTLLISGTLGYYFSHLVSHPKSRINKRLPKIGIKFFQLTPHVKLRFKKRDIHLHHWMNFTVLLVLTFTIGGEILGTVYSKGFLLGGIIQGLTFPDWKKIVIKKDI